MRNVVIVAAKRTALGKFHGIWEQRSAVELGTAVVRALFEDTGVDAADAQTLVFGNVLSAGLGQNMARQVALGAGLSPASTAYTLNMVCGSGLKAVAQAAGAIALGQAEIAVAGGSESMTNAPRAVLDNDGLTDAFTGQRMGMTAETVAARYRIARERQDAFALESHRRAVRAAEAGDFADEIVPLDGIAHDEGPRPDTSMAKLARLTPAFQADGMVTAGNASGLSDGAAAVLLMSADKAHALGLTPLATITAYAEAGVDPAVMGLAPIVSTEKLFRQTGLTAADLDLVELNEAFAATTLAVMDALQLDPARTNPHGGALALGHPLGASGARILVTLVHAMQRQHAKRGLVTICVGGGQGLSLLVERPHD